MSEATEPTPGKDPESYTDIYMKKYTGASKKPSLEKRKVSPEEYTKNNKVDMNKENIEDNSDATKNFSEKPRTVVSVHPDDTPTDLGYSEHDVAPSKVASEKSSPGHDRDWCA